MKKTGLFIFMTFLLFILDIGLTIFHMGFSYHLVSEGNPLIHYQNGFYLLWANLVYFMLIIGSVLYLKFYKTIIIEAKNAKEYTKKLYQSNYVSFILACACFSFMLGSFVSRGYAVFDWLMFTIFHQLFFDSLYFNIRDIMPFQRFDIVMGFLSLTVVMPLFFKLEFEASVKLIGDKNEKHI